MKKEEWITSNSAPDMLLSLRQAHGDFLGRQVLQLHKFLVACCWKHQHLIPQKGLRDGLRAAERWIAGKIDDEELNRANWYAEAEAFAIDYAASSDEIAEVESLIAAIDELRALPFADAREKLLAAAYFVEGAMVYPMLRSLPWSQRLFTSPFLCPALLRKCVRPTFG
jgi:hypothetical protein